MSKIRDKTPDLFGALVTLLLEQGLNFPSQTDEDHLRSLLANREFERGWKKALLSPIESVIRDANRQIRATKERLGAQSARGVVLLFNEGNRLHAYSIQHYMRLVGEVVQKPAGDGRRRFAHIDGVVYFSLDTVEVFDELTRQHMPFWFPAQVAGDSVSEIVRFQEDLKSAWFRYIKEQTGAEVVSHRRETGWPSQ